MMDLYYAPTPNGWKITIMLEECGLPYVVHPVRLDADEQHHPDFTTINPNGRIPVLIDSTPLDGGPPLTIFESGAILYYLGQRTGRFLPAESRKRTEVLQWLMWQMSGLGPMLGQHGHFRLYAREQIPYAIHRYEKEARRLYGVLDARLGVTGAYIVDEYSVVDIACFPWIMTHKAQGISLDEFPHIRRWYSAVRARPRVQAGLAVLEELRNFAGSGQLRGPDPRFGSPESDEASIADSEPPV